MTAAQILVKELNRIYLGKTIESDTGKPFVVAAISVEDGDYGDPPVEIKFEGAKYVEAWRQYGIWSEAHRDKDYVPAPAEISRLQDEGYDEFREVSSTMMELPIVL